MRLSDKVTINAPIEKTWEFMTNADEVARCAPGVESVEEIEKDQKYKAVASVGFGSIKENVQALDLGIENRFKLFDGFVHNPAIRQHSRTVNNSLYGANGVSNIV